MERVILKPKTVMQFNTDYLKVGQTVYVRGRMKVGSEIDEKVVDGLAVIKCVYPDGDRLDVKFLNAQQVTYGMNTLLLAIHVKDVEEGRVTITPATLLSQATTDELIDELVSRDGRSIEDLLSRLQKSKPGSEE